jgi:two-component system chemotaxis sensor kinase CheA
VLLFDQLASQGALTARVDASAVPGFDELDPTSCHLAWTLELAGSDAGTIGALFGWLDDLCPITVEIATAAVTAAPAAAPVATAPAASAPAAAAPREPRARRRRRRSGSGSTSSTR